MAYGSSSVKSGTGVSERLIDWLVTLFVICEREILLLKVTGYLASVS